MPGFGTSAVNLKLSALPATSYEPKNTLVMPGYAAKRSRPHCGRTVDLPLKGPIRWVGLGVQNHLEVVDPRQSRRTGRPAPLGRRLKIGTRCQCPYNSTSRWNYRGDHWCPHWPKPHRQKPSRRGSYGIQVDGQGVDVVCLRHKRQRTCSKACAYVGRATALRPCAGRARIRN